MDSLAISEASVDDIFRILIATDTHLGYGEDDPERCMCRFDDFTVMRVCHEKMN